jgi:hypothetical protein
MLERLPPSESEDNPYASPLAEVHPPLHGSAEGSLAPRYAAREGIIRGGGLIGLILSVLVLAVFGLGFLSEFRKIAIAEGGIDPWKYRLYIARATSALSVISLAVVTNWGLLRLRRWARWVFSCASILPTQLLILVYLSPRLAGIPERKGSMTASDLIIAVAALGLFCVPILYVLWSRAGMVVFSDDYLDTSRQVNEKRYGCLPIMGAVAFGFAQGVAYTGLALTVMAILESVGLLPS